MNDIIPVEQETKLIICSENPLDIVQEIIDLDNISNYNLGPRSSQVQVDIYFDTSNELLSKQQWDLRLRMSNRLYKVALKGPREEINSEYSARPEYEDNWEVPPPHWLIDQLHELGVDSENSSEIEISDPIEFLRNLGLEPVQIRRTLRYSRFVYSHASKNNPVSEFVIDCVDYEFPEMVVKHYELEVELIEGDVRVMSDIVENLISKYGHELQVWNKSGKFGIGKAIEALLQQSNLLEGLKDNTLSPSSYKRIYEWLTLNEEK